MTCALFEKIVKECINNFDSNILLNTKLNRFWLYNKMCAHISFRFASVISQYCLVIDETNNTPVMDYIECFYLYVEINCITYNEIYNSRIIKRSKIINEILGI